MISILGSLSFAKLVVMSSAPAKSAGMPDARPKIRLFNQRCRSHTILTPICIRSAFFLRERNKRLLNYKRAGGRGTSYNQGTDPTVHFNGYLFG